MRHATISDAFNAASYFTQQTLEMFTKEKEYELDTELFKQSIEMEKFHKELIADYTRIDDKGENVFQQNPEAYQKHVQERLAEWRRNAEAAGNGSRYYMDRLGRMDAQGNEAMRQRTAAVIDDAARQRVDVAHAKAYAEIDNSGWDIQKTLEAKTAELERYKSVRGLSHIDEYKEKAGIINSLFDRSLNIDIGNLTVADAMKAVDDNISFLEEIFTPYLSEGETFDSFLDQKQERLSDARQAVRMAIWKRNYNYGEALDNEYRRIAADAMKTDDNSLIRYAQRLWREGSQLREIAMESPEYNPDDRHRITNWFPLVGGLIDNGGRSSVSIADRIKESRDYWITSGAEGRSAQGEARASYMQEMGDLAREAGFDNIDEFEHRYSREIDFFGMYEDTKDALIKKNPGYADAFRSLDTFIDTWKGQVKDPQEKALREQQGRRIAAYFFDTILDAHGEARITPDQMQRETMRLTGLLASDKISFLRETVDNSSRFTIGTNSDQDFGKAVYEMSQHPWARFVADGKVNTFGDEQYRQDVENMAMDKFKTITGISLSNMSIGHSKEGMYDETPEINIIVSGRGTENGTYRFAADPDGNYWIERQTDNGWERDPRYTETAKEAGERQWWEQREEHAEAQRQSEQATARSGMLNSFELIRREEDPVRRKALTDTLQSTVPRDEFWKAGINPNSGAAVTEIPAREWDRILGGMPESQREEQEQEWRRMGIAKGR